MLPPMPDRGDTRGTRDRATLTAFVLLVTVAGGNAVAIRESSCDSCELDPFWAAAMRLLLAAVILAVVALGLRVGMPHGRALLGAVLFGTLQFGAGIGLVYWGFVRAPAGIGQVLLACVPLFTFGLALAHHQERFRWEGLVGASLAAVGIAVIFNTGIDTGVPLSAMLAILAAAICWAEALIVVKSFPPVHPAAMNAIAMGVGTAILFTLSAIVDEAHVIPEDRSTWLAVTYLVTAGSIGVFWLYVFVLRGWTASAASYQMVLIPLVTVVLSAWLQDEPITWAFAAGSILVLAGVYFGALRRRAVEEGMIRPLSRASTQTR
jgi:drug/metabolite transporter (DMT)-like permease